MTERTLPYVEDQVPTGQGALDRLSVVSQLHTATQRIRLQTPAEAAGIKVEGQDKWLTLIQNAKRQSAK